MAESGRVVVLGGGFAGLEAAFALQEHAGSRAHITLVARRGRFVMRPATLRIPFGAPLDSAHVDIGPATARRGILFVHSTVDGIDTGAGIVHTVEGRRLAYDRLVVATGAVPDSTRVPGLTEYGLSIWNVDDLLQLRHELARVVESAEAGRRSTILFALPPGNACPKPLYELVLSTDAWLRKRRVRAAVELNFSTFERSYMQALGDVDHEVTAEFHRLGIHGNRLYALSSVERGRALYRNGAAIGYDVLVTHPPQQPAVRYAELACDAQGWLLTDAGTRSSPGHPEVLVAGDASATSVRMAYRALLEGDQAASSLAGWLYGPGFHPAELPRVEDGFWMPGSRAWRTGQQLAGAYLARRFRRGLPLESELGLRALSKMVV
jgi:sulfide:quinone oxidoreductase